jgi:hypothetical protein
MQDPEYELRRILLLRTRVNKGKKKGRSCYAPAREPLGRPLYEAVTCWAAENSEVSPVAFLVVVAVICRPTAAAVVGEKVKEASLDPSVDTFFCPMPQALINQPHSAACGGVGCSGAGNRRSMRRKQALTQTQQRAVERLAKGQGYTCIECGSADYLESDTNALQSFSNMNVALFCKNPDAEHPEFLRPLDAQSYICVPLQVKGRLLGALGLVTVESKRRYDQDDLILAEGLARCTALAFSDPGRAFSPRRHWPSSSRSGRPPVRTASGWE